MRNTEFLKNKITSGTKIVFVLLLVGLSFLTVFGFNTELVYAHHTVPGCEWIRTYDGGFGSDKGYGVAADATNVHVSGYFTDSSTFHSQLLKKYDRFGNEQWAIINSVNNRNTGGADVAVDASGNTYVTGSTESYDTTTGNWKKDMRIRKYNSNGNLIWYNGYGVSNQFNEEGIGVTLDLNGNVYVAGKAEISDASSGGNTETRAIVVKFNSAGERVWVRYYADDPTSNYGNHAYDISADASGNLYVAGTGKFVLGGITGDQGSFWVFKLSSSNGDMLWSKSYGSTSTFNNANGVAFDPLSNSIYVAGQKEDWDTHFTLVLKKLNANNGNQIWERNFNGFGGPGGSNAEGQDIGLDAMGNVYVAGYALNDFNPFPGDMPPQSRDILTLKYLPDGTLIGGKIYNGNANGVDEGFGISVRGNELYVTGYENTVGQGTNIILLKYCGIEDTNHWFYVGYGST